MNCDCNELHCSKRVLFQQGTSVSSSLGDRQLTNEEFTGNCSDNEMDGDLEDDQCVHSDGPSAMDYSLASEHGESEPDAQTETKLSAADRILCASAFYLAHNMSKDSFVDLQRLSPSPILFSTVSKILKNANAECEKIIRCFGCGASLDSSRSVCCSSQQLAALSKVSVREVYSRIVRRNLDEIIATHDLFHQGFLSIVYLKFKMFRLPTSGLSRTDRYKQVIETKNEFAARIIRTPILLNADGFSKSGCRGEVWPVFFALVDLPDRVRWRASSYGLPRCATLLSCRFSHSVANALFHGLHEEFVDLCTNPVRLHHNGQEFSVCPSIYSFVSDIAATVKIFDLDHWALSNAEGCSMCTTRATRDGSRNVWELRPCTTRELTDHSPGEASKLAPLSLVRAEFLHNDAFGYIKSIVRRIFGAPDSSAFGKMLLRRGSTRMCSDSVSSARLPTSRVRDLRVPTENGRSLCGSEYAVLAMTILPVACLNRVFENDVVNSLCPSLDENAI
ncbi:hypothetical protein PMAYCL1PPCAC_29959 [Pristionchus mayeri]|uniref:Uncharacterized protein n=1 Tax=Pristionchus mayeri TaxID=1317129 RepID=A0AAN5DB12_9BILA|nr:hypothetical protein PMAYCL1PPCAC_29959 [Pristionchus mayeri]